MCQIQIQKKIVFYGKSIQKVVPKHSLKIRKFFMQKMQQTRRMVPWFSILCCRRVLIQKNADQRHKKSHILDSIILDRHFHSAHVSRFINIHAWWRDINQPNLQDETFCGRIIWRIPKKWESLKFSAIKCSDWFSSSFVHRTWGRFTVAHDYVSKRGWGLFRHLIDLLMWKWSKFATMYDSFFELPNVGIINSDRSWLRVLDWCICSHFFDLLAFYRKQCKFHQTHKYFDGHWL